MCEERNEKGTLCAAHFWNINHFQDHLRNEHRWNDYEKIRAVKTTSKLGRLGFGSFWCGFCRKRIDFENDHQDVPIQNQRMRFNHIEVEHFKKGQKIWDWIPAEAAAAQLKNPGQGRTMNDDDSISSDESQGTRLSGDTLVQRASQSAAQSDVKSVDPRQLQAEVPRHRVDVFLICVSYPYPRI